MWNAKKKYLFLVVCLICLILIQSCAKGERQAGTSFEFVKADRYFVPPSNEVVAILLYLYGGRDCNGCPMDCNFCPLIALIGDKTEAEKIIGKELEPLKLVKGNDWLEKIMNGYSVALKEAEEKKFEGWSMGNLRIVFVTRNKGYTRNLDFNEDSVLDEYMESELLGDYFKELGFIPIEPRQAEEYFIPPKDKTVVILLYRYQSSEFEPYPPVAIFGDKKLAEKLLYGDKELMEKILYIDKVGMEEKPEGFIPGKSLEPKKVFEGREWLEKIMDAYETALKEARERGRNEIRGYKRGTIHDGSIVFVTQNEAYTREIKVGERAIQDDDMDSEQLKAYFDELGLTGELLGGKPPRKFEVVLAGDYFVPTADETAAILLHKWPTGKEDFNTPVALFGDKEMMGEIMGRSFEPKKLFEDRDLLKKIMVAYKTALQEAKESHFERDRSGSLARITFVTPTKGYLRFIDIDEDENTVCENYMESEPLKTLFDKIGLTDELLMDRPEFVLTPARKYQLPSTDKIVSILLYPQLIGYSYNHPVALFGDKGLTKKLMAGVEKLGGNPLEPTKVFEGRDWLVKITDAYRNALKEAEENKFRRKGDTNGRIIFITAKNGYEKFIGVDANTVYDNYMESKTLKKYFDELGLTKELLAGEPNAVRHPQADEAP